MNNLVLMYTSLKNINKFFSIFDRLTKKTFLYTNNRTVLPLSFTQIILKDQLFRIRSLKFKLKIPCQGFLTWICLNKQWTRVKVPWVPPTAPPLPHPILIPFPPVFSSISHPQPPLPSFPSTPLLTKTMNK